MRIKKTFVFAVCAVASSFLSNVVATPINYGDFTGSSVMYLDVTETANTTGDEEPLYGPPSIIVDTLDFDPGGFSAVALDDLSDLTDGQLNFTLMGQPNVAISSITLSESGDYSLTGTGTAATRISYAVAISQVTVLELDGVTLSSPVTLSAASASGGDDLSNGSDLLTPWSLSLTYDVNAALTNAGVDFQFGATKLEIALNNSLAAISEPLSIAYIAKKDFKINVSSEVIPEPTSFALAGMILGGLALLRRCFSK